MSVTRKNGIRDGLKITGRFELWLLDLEGVVLQHIVERNLVVDTGLSLASETLLGAAVTHIAVGTNGAEAAPGDVVPLQDQFLKELDDAVAVGTGSIRFDFEIAADECNGVTMREFGLVAVDGETQTLFARKGGKSIAKTEDFSVLGQWTINLQ